MMARFFGANWKTTVSAIGTAIFGALTALAGLPYQLGDIATVIPPEWKGPMFKWSLLATVALKIWNGVAQKSKEVTGGTIQQTVNGTVAKEGTQTLVDETVRATVRTGEPITPEQARAMPSL